MKSKNSETIGSVALGIMLALALMIMGSPPAQAQTPDIQLLLTNTLTISTNYTTTNATYFEPVDARMNACAIAITGYGVGTNAVALTFELQRSLDATNWASCTNLSFTLASTSTTTAYDVYKGLLAGWNFLKIRAVGAPFLTTNTAVITSIKMGGY